jgi:hypothetical protein
MSRGAEGNAESSALAGEDEGNYLQMKLWDIELEIIEKRRRRGTCETSTLHWSERGRRRNAPTARRCGSIWMLKGIRGGVNGVGTLVNGAGNGRRKTMRSR